jgi:hypothetical protein
LPRAEGGLGRAARHGIDGAGVVVCHAYLSSVVPHEGSAAGFVHSDGRAESLLVLCSQALGGPLAPVPRAIIDAGALGVTASSALDPRTSLESV